MFSSRWEQHLALELLLLLHLFLATTIQGTFHKLSACACVPKGVVRCKRTYGVWLNPGGGVRYFHLGSRIVASWRAFFSFGESGSISFPKGMTKTRSWGDVEVSPLYIVTWFVVCEVSCLLNKRKLYTDMAMFHVQVHCAP